MSNSLRVSKTFLSSAFVKISAQLRADATFVILHEPFRIWSLKWYHLTAKCLVLGLCCSVVASTIQPELSSQISDCTNFSHLFVKYRWVFVFDWSATGSCPNFMNVVLYISRTSCRIGSKVLIRVLRAMYSASVVLSSIYVCSLLVHIIGQPQ